MLMFCGDSHARQFHFEAPGQYSFNSFTSATMKGLATIGGRIGHRETVLALAAAPRPKTLFLMFGGVDLDVTVYRKLALGEPFEEDRFSAARAGAMTEFVGEVFARSAKVVRRICILLPHLPTLDDNHFASRTAIMARLPETALVDVAAQTDCSHLARCLRTRRFNDRLIDSIAQDDRIRLFRVDDAMADASGLIQPRFLRRSRKDHHAAHEETLPLWQDRLQDEVPFFKKLVERRRVG